MKQHVQIQDVHVHVDIHVHDVHVKPPPQFSRLGTQVSYSLSVYMFVLFGCSVLGLGFLSSLPLQLVSALYTCIFT